MYCTNEHGSALFDATLGDEDVLEDLYRAELVKQSKKLKDPDDDKPYHPSRRGYTREVEAILDVADNLIAMRAEAGKWRGSSTRFSARPLFPAQAVQERLRKRNMSIRDEKIKAAQQRWDRDNPHPT